MTTARSNSKPKGPLRLLMPVLGVGLIVVCAIVLLGSGGERHTVSEVVRSIRKAALAGNEPDAPYGSGRIGPWKIAADHVDPLTGELSNFRIQSGAMMIAARTAQILVDPEADTFGFELHGVVYTRVPAGGDGAADDDEAFVHDLERHVLGPAPYGVDIIPDRPGAKPRPGDTSKLSRAGLDEK
ncbi:MAG: hypothetical protein GY715_22365 [Planctomycetes bacterium]|nr:hypothetical protein [Planctomycetota bacterium]